MAALSATLYSNHRLHRSSNSLIHQVFMIPAASCCQRRPADVVACHRGGGGTTSGGTKGTKESKQLSSEMLLGSLDKFGKGLKESLSPKQKGDWKDVVLMSLSFAVYVYMSQQLVCAYCVWKSMMK
ncbi:hypothetical protein LINGRAHAP2_LOCUS30238 [Linum grandiflorum]